MKGSIHHIELWVSDLQKTIRFWSWILEYLGYVKHQEWQNGISWKLENTYIAFEQTTKENLNHPYNKKSIGINHLAFHLDSKNQLTELVDKLQKSGINLLFQDNPKYKYTGDNQVIHIADPDGIEIEFVAA